MAALMCTVRNTLPGPTQPRSHVRLRQQTLFALMHRQLKVTWFPLSVVFARNKSSDSDIPSINTGHDLAEFRTWSQQLVPESGSRTAVALNASGVEGEMSSVRTRHGTARVVDPSRAPHYSSTSKLMDQHSTQQDQTFGIKEMPRAHNMESERVSCSCTEYGDRECSGFDFFRGLGAALSPVKDQSLTQRLNALPVISNGLSWQRPCLYVRPGDCIAGA
eukprot:1763536-Rhodomonas_salina.1